MLSKKEKLDKKGNILYVSILYTIVQNANESNVTKNRPVVAWVQEMIAMGDEDTLRVIDMLIILTIVMVSQVHMYVKTYNFCTSKYVQFIVCQVRLNQALKINRTV